MTAGAGSALCASQIGQAVFGVINSFTNNIIEQPIIDVVDTVEKGAVAAVKAVGNWFSSWF